MSVIGNRREFRERIDSERMGPSVLPAAPSSLCAKMSRRLLESEPSVPRDSEFMHTAVDIIRDVLQPKLLFIGVLKNQGHSVSTFMTIRDGERVDNFSYSLEHSPCATVLGPQELCIYPEEVAALFPLDRGLTALRAEGYVGMPLLARDGTKIGIIAGVTTDPIDNLDEIRSTLQVFGTRLGLEVERAIAERAGEDDIDQAVLVEEQGIIFAVRRCQ